MAIGFEERFSNRSPDTFVAVNKGVCLCHMIGVGRGATHNIRSFIVATIFSRGKRETSKMPLSVSASACTV